MSILAFLSLLPVGDGLDELTEATGELRFKPPQSYAWDATSFNATSTPNACSQDPEEVSRPWVDSADNSVLYRGQKSRKTV
jgi:hypothetical protein